MFQTLDTKRAEFFYVVGKTLLFERRVIHPQNTQEKSKFPETRQDKFLL
ncbi:Phage terminase, large subunit (plasmid) [Bacillus cereus]|nr:Phage terminase, large subunit [Bacillus cereus]